MRLNLRDFVFYVTGSLVTSLSVVGKLPFLVGMGLGVVLTVLAAAFGFAFDLESFNANTDD